MKSFLIAAFILLASILSSSQSFTTQSYPIGGSAVQVIQADFNGDHIPDIATVNQNQNTVSILINNGDGTFRAPLTFATGLSPISIAAVDLNKDGKMDLVVANNQAAPGASVSILIGNGDGTFQPHRDINGGPTPTSITVGDFNHDGNSDIATSSASQGNAVYVELGDGKGGILAQKITTGFGQQPQPGEHAYVLTKIVRADFNRDGNDDLYFIQCCGGFDVPIGAWGVLAGKGDGTFTNPFVAQLSVPIDVFAIDINQDGLSDIVIPYSGCHTPCEGVEAFINQGSTFGLASNVEVDQSNPGGTAFDVEGDGLKDVISVESSNGSTMELLISSQNVDGTFQQGLNLKQVPIAAPFVNQPSVVAADFNHDGKIDLAYVGQGDTNVTVVLNTTPRAACTLRTTDHSVTLCQPSDGAVLTSPVQIVSHATSSTAVDATQLYLDNVLVFQTTGGTLNRSQSLTPGNHLLEVKNWSQGKSFRNDFHVTGINAVAPPPPQCTASVNFTVNICSPGANANVSSPVHVVAAAKSTVKIVSMQIYLDGKLVFNMPNVSQISTDVPAAKGAHNLAVKAWDSSGRSFLTIHQITVQ
jgi:hypothetical protein